LIVGAGAMSDMSAPASSPDPQLRRAVTADAVVVRELTRLAYQKWMPLIGREPKPMTTDFDRAIREHIVDLMLTGERVVALIETIPGRDHLFVENIAVLPECQGRGFGRRMMQHAEGIAVSVGLPAIRLYTNKLFVDNLRFYERLGYRVDGEESFKGGFLVHMSKRVR
jgi:ribosomal protein S18 acetylase RimI-like enzyme